MSCSFGGGGGGVGRRGALNADGAAARRREGQAPQLGQRDGFLPGADLVRREPEAQTEDLCFLAEPGERVSGSGPNNSVYTSQVDVRPVCKTFFYGGGKGREGGPARTTTYLSCLLSRQARPG